MQELFKQPYEISLWEDVLTFVTNIGEFEETLPEDRTYNVITQYYKERKKLILGGDKVTSPLRAFNPKLIQNINGLTTLSFQIFNRYYDEENDCYLNNPFIKDLINERKVKLRIGAPGVLKPKEKVLLDEQTYEKNKYYIKNEITQKYELCKEENFDPTKNYYKENDANGPTKDCRWYDFVIKEVQEDSKSEVFTYTAKSLFLNELSKTGFDLEFDTKLGNNVGNLKYLGNKILEGSDWKLKDNNLLLKQKREEPLYVGILNQEICAENLEEKERIELSREAFLPNTYYIFNEETNNYELSEFYNSEEKYYQNKIVTIPKDSIIYIFYSVITNQENYFQFLWSNEQIEKDSKNVITNEHINWHIDVTYDYNQMPLYKNKALLQQNFINITLTKERYQPNKYYYGSFSKGIILCTDEKYDPNKKYYQIDSLKISNEYRGNRLVRKPITKFDPSIKKYINIFTDSKGKEYYGFQKTEYISPTVVYSYVTNSSGFTNTTGWEVGNLDVIGSLPDLSVVTAPDLRLPSSTADIEDFSSFLRFEARSSTSALYNSGISDYRHSIEGFSKGEIYTIKLKYGTAVGSDKYPENVVTTSKPVNIKIGIYSMDDKGTYILHNSDIIFEKKLQYDKSGEILDEANNHYIEEDVEALRDFSYNDLLGKKIGILLTFDVAGVYFIKDLQFFKKIIIDNQQVYPGNRELFAKAATMYCYYTPNERYKEEADVKFDYKSDVPWDQVTIKYNTETFEKVRTLKASQTNRYNLIMTLCELFECWASFEVEYKKDEETGYQDGTIALENYRQKKYVVFRDYLGKENFSGFRYGINLKDINRKIESNNIVSKIVVKNNSNQFAENGFCTIARADENYCKENFIYDFSYYIRSKLLNFDAVNNDLYMPKYINYQEGIESPQKYLGYYKELKYLNQDRDTLINEQSILVKDIPKYNSDKQTYENQAERAAEGSRDKQLDIIRMTTFSYDHFLNLKDDPWWSNDEFLQTMISIAQYGSSAKKYRALADEAYKLLKKAEQKFADNRHKLDILRDKKQKLHEEFYAKYSRFIQEGTWIKEDYVDDNLYYLDAENVLREASQPKVSYTINVLDLSQLDEYQGYTFNLGDKTFIEDLEFFGWDFDHSAPYKEEIVVTELTLNLDSPEQNVIKVQNYKSNFEDLFQRMTATTQALEYSNGKYSKTSDTIDEEGKIKVDVLQNSIAGNSLKLQNAKDQSVIWDDTGITTTCLSKPNEVVRIFSGGIMMSEDGGNSWATGISGDGINANYIVTGQLDTQKIRILNGNQPSFVWDSSGINAYYYEIDSETGSSKGYNPRKFVRFDRHGLYSIYDKENYNPDLAENPELQIQQDSPFSLTWSGFQIHSQHNDGGQIRITPENDIELLKKDKEGFKALIKIGLLGKSGKKNLYGIRIADDSGNSIMETGNNGKMWIRDAIYIGNKDMPSTQNVSLGFLPSQPNGPFTTNKNGAQQVFNASNQFIVYADGSITAQSGSIGGVDIEAITSNVSGKIDLLSPKGTIFKIKDGISEPSCLEFKVQLSNISLKDITSIIWSGSGVFGEDSEILLEKINKNNNLTSEDLVFSFSYDSFLQKNVKDKYYINVTVNYNGSKGAESHEDATSITAVHDNAESSPESNDIKLIIDSSNGDFFRNNTGSTQLTAKLYKGGKEIDQEGTEYMYTWTGLNFPTLIGKTITLYAFQISDTLTIQCEVHKR